MDTVLRGLDCTFVYIDDILVASRSKAKHMVHLRQVLERLQQQGLVINLAKCQFGRHELDFLGHHITKHGATPLPSKVTAIREFSRPSTVKGLQEFVGMVNFYHRFVPAAASIMQPLYKALVGKPKVLQWNDQMISTFNLTKEALASATMLAHPLTDAPTAVTVDASGVAVGAVLEQLIHGSSLAGSSVLLRKSTVHLIVSSSHSTWQSVTSVTSLKDGTSLHSQIINHSYSPLPKCQILGLLDSNGTSLQYPNTQPASSTSQERAMKWLMHCLAQSSMLCIKI